VRVCAIKRLRPGVQKRPRSGDRAILSTQRRRCERRQVRYVPSGPIRAIRVRLTTSS